MVYEGVGDCFRRFEVLRDFLDFYFKVFDVEGEETFGGGGERLLEFVVEIVVIEGFEVFKEI